MQFDVFFSICQTDVDGYMPSEAVMFRNFFDQVRLADELGYGTAWVAETHLSCEVQKENRAPVIPQFKGEIGLNTDILQLAHKVFGITKRIHVGSAIRNILCNGGPIAHAEAVRTFMTYHGLDPAEKRELHLGFAAGRFPFSNAPYGILPRSALERAAWPVVRNKLFQEATEIFLRFLKGEVFSSEDVTAKVLRRADFRADEDWAKVQAAHGSGMGASMAEIPVPPFWTFEKVGVIPREAPMERLKLVLGTHDAQTQIQANRILPCGVFNLSITPAHEIEATHQRMQAAFHPAGGKWTRAHMPRTVLVFINDDPGVSEAEQNARALNEAQRAIENYWRAMEGTLDPARVKSAVGNALAGNPRTIIEQMRARFNPGDRVMLWFDFNNHDNAQILHRMRVFQEQIAAEVSVRGQA
ncbi:MAG: LLM class flavin-dependent oxidoreductase [Bacteriovoracia bacterium]